MSNTPANSRPEHDAHGEHAPDDDIPPSIESPTDDRSIVVDILVDDSVKSHASSDSISSAVIASAAHRGYTRGEIGVRITGDETIRKLNRKHLGHDYATDVISFGYSAEGDRVTGELVISADTAACLDDDDSPGWSANAELLLYVVHGTLHITGMDDHDDDDRAAMRQAEESIMTALGFAEARVYGADKLISPSATSCISKESRR